LVIVPRKGAFVSQLSSAELRDINEVRIRLETMALELAFKYDPEALISDMKKSLDIQSHFVETNNIAEYFGENVKFHHLYIKRSRNAYLMASLQDIDDLVLHNWVVSIYWSPARVGRRGANLKI